MLPVYEAHHDGARLRRTAVGQLAAISSDRLNEEVAAAVSLAEGAAGVRDILAAIAVQEPVSIRQLSRRVEIPVPVVAAVCNELRHRDLVAASRPVRLTDRGRAVAARPGTGHPDRCGACHGRGTVLPAALRDATDRLADLAADTPRARPDLDQSHCTADTKLRRALLLAERGLLGGPIAFLGDDDLTALAVALVVRQLGMPAPTMAVVDVDPRVLEHIGSRAEQLGANVELYHHDLRAPLPKPLRGQFEVVVTDPPYTITGAALFMSRAVAALRPGSGGHVLLAFGARRPDETVRLQRLFGQMALAVRSLAPNFNDYHGAGVLGGTSHLYHLRTTSTSRPRIPGHHPGPLYTADERPRLARYYRCTGCGRRYPVGPGQPYAEVAALTQTGCPGCGGHRFRPLSRRPDGGRP